jgi:hypothetical protein
MLSGQGLGQQDRDAFSRAAARHADIETVDLRGADLADVGKGAHGGS